MPPLSCIVYCISSSYIMGFLFTTLRLTACMVLIALRASPLSEGLYPSVVQPQAKQWVGNGVGVFGAGDEVVFKQFQSCGLC